VLTKSYAHKDNCKKVLVEKKKEKRKKERKKKRKTQQHR
jgi:hypothetical protein